MALRQHGKQPILTHGNVLAVERVGQRHKAEVHCARAHIGVYLGICPVEEPEARFRVLGLKGLHHRGQPAHGYALKRRNANDPAACLTHIAYGGGERRLRVYDLTHRLIHAPPLLRELCAGA